MAKDNERKEDSDERRRKASVPCCAVGPSQRPAIQGWSRPVAVISPELSEATACATGERNRGTEK